MNCEKPLDARIDAELLALVQEATQMIPAMYGAKYSADRDEHGHPKDFSLLWCAYLSTAIFANAQGVVALAVHDCGIQAEALERQGYEALKRLEYYVNNKDIARLEWLASPWRDKKLFDEMGMDKSCRRYQETIDALNAVKQKFPEVEQHAMKNKGREISFADMVGISNDPMAAKEYAFRYRKPSQLTHLAAGGSEHFLRSDGTPARVIMNFSSSVLEPNTVLEKVAMSLIAFADILDQAMKANRGNEISAMDARLNSVLLRLHPQNAHDCGSLSSQTT